MVVWGLYEVAGWEREFHGIYSSEALAKQCMSALDLVEGTIVRYVVDEHAVKLVSGLRDYAVDLSVSGAVVSAGPCVRVEHEGYYSLKSDGRLSVWGMFESKRAALSVAHALYARLRDCGLLSRAPIKHVPLPDDLYSHDQGSPCDE